MPATQQIPKPAKDYIAAKPHEPVKCYECQKPYANRWTLQSHLAQAHGIS